jgi:2-methylfumaryl-CoA hydratase
MSAPGPTAAGVAHRPDAEDGTMREFECGRQIERAAQAPLHLCGGVRAPSYGRYLEDFADGAVFVHPRGMTLDRGLCQDFATTFLECNPLYLNAEYARACGYETAPASPLLVLATVLSLGVQNDSEKAIAHLGYYDVFFPRPTYPGDTLRASTRVVRRQERGETEPGIVSVRTIGLNQRDELVLQYDRKILVPRRPAAAQARAAGGATPRFPDTERQLLSIPDTASRPTDCTGASTYFEDFAPGQIILHANGRTVTDEHFGWTYRVGNTHPLHFDRLYSTARSGAMSGEPIVYGGLVFAWLAGLASRDTSENALYDLGYTEGYHTQPTVAGDTLYAVSRVLACESGPAGMDAGIVSFQLVGLKNIDGRTALDRYGADLFVKENDKRKLGKDKAPEKIFEIERRLLIRRRPAGV